MCVRIKIRDSHVTTPLAGVAKYEIMKQFLLKALGHIRPARKEAQRADKPPFKRLSMTFHSSVYRTAARERGRSLDKLDERHSAD